MNADPAKVALVRRLGPFDASMIVMGGIVGSGIFMNPSVVANIAPHPELILGSWLMGGLIALAGAFVYAELSARRPEVGGQYVYLREAYHPLVAFLYGWTLFLISNCGGMAAVAMTFASYFVDLTGFNMSEWSVAVIVIATLTVVNCMGVRAGGTVQNVLMVLKILAILLLIGFGVQLVGGGERVPEESTHSLETTDSIIMFGAALIPVMFAFGGWQTACFIAGEVREPERNLPRGLLYGVAGVIVLYLAVNYVCVYALGPEELAKTSTPATDIMRLALGETGAKMIAIGITISTLGFLSQSVLTAPRVYYAMAADRLFFKSVANVHPKTHVPVVAIVLQGVVTILIATTGNYHQILGYVVSNDFVFFGLTAGCLFVFRNRDKSVPAYEMPGYPILPFLFVLVCVYVFGNAIYSFPYETTIGLVITLTGVPVYYLWKRRLT